jgi:P27 family predicted phage terminase small subunit
MTTPAAPRKRGARLAVTALPRRTITPPRELGEAGLDLWTRIWGSGAAWLSEELDAESVLVLCEMTDDYAALRKRTQAPLLDDEDVPLAGGEKRTYDSLRDLRRQINDATAALGLTPSGRAKMAVTEAAPEDPLVAFRQQDTA